MKTWHSSLRRSLELGYADPDLLNHIDDLLRWYSDINGRQLDGFSSDLIDELGAVSFKARFEDCLDRLIISNGEGVNSLVFSGLSPKLAKWRYRKLISVFHPDKGANSQAWLNFRAEKINKLYKQYKLGLAQDHSLIDDVEKENSYSETSRNSENQTRPHKRRSDKPRSRASSGFDWRSRFGDPAKLERRITIFLITCVAFGCILTLMAYSSS